jgi:hypothetical protein
MVYHSNFRMVLLLSRKNALFFRELLALLEVVQVREVVLGAVL